MAKVLLSNGNWHQDQDLSDSELKAFGEQVTCYKDQDLWLVNKPAGLLSVPGRVVQDSLLQRLLNLDPRTLLIHRLDMDTRGLMVFALNKEAQSSVSKQFIARDVSKRYESLVAGVMGQQGDFFDVEVPVRYEPSMKPKHVVDLDHPKHAHTRVWVRSVEALDGLAVTRAELEPVTGRSHQLRVHMLHLGHVIVGDPIYATGQALEAKAELALFSKHLGFTHPSTHKAFELSIEPSF